MGLEHMQKRIPLERMQERIAPGTYLSCAYCEGERIAPGTYAGAHRSCAIEEVRENTKKRASAAAPSKAAPGLRLALLVGSTCGMATKAWADIGYMGGALQERFAPHCLFLEMQKRSAPY